MYSREVLRAYVACGKLVPPLPETVITHSPGRATQLSTTGSLMCYVLYKAENPSGACV